MHEAQFEVCLLKLEGEQPPQELNCCWFFSQTPAEGASITIYAAAASEMEGVGSCYLYNGEKRQSSDLSYDSELQVKLWKKSCELVGLKKA